MGMAVADMTDIVDHIEIGITINVIEELFARPHNVEWFTVRDTQIASQVLAAAGQQFRFGRCSRPKSRVRNLENQVRVGAETQPYLSFTGRGDAIKATTVAQQIGDNLKM